jgi:hypothetical protein
MSQMLRPCSIEAPELAAEVLLERLERLERLVPVAVAADWAIPLI